MSLLFRYGIYLAASVNFNEATPLLRRQSTATQQYITDVRTALYVVNNIATDNALSSCTDADLPNRLNGQGYNGDYAQQLL